MFSLGATPGGETTKRAGLSTDSGKATSSSVSQADPNCTVLATVNDKCAAWLSVYDNPNGHTVSSHGLERAVGLVVGPKGDRIYTTGISNGRGADASVDGDAFATVANNAVTGAQEWVARYDGGPNSSGDDPVGLALTSDGSRLYLLGSSGGIPVNEPGATNVTNGFTVVAYDAANGAQLWAAQHLNPFDPNSLMFGRAIAIAVSPDGSHVFVTGMTGAYNLVSNTSSQVFTTAAFDSSGQKLWSTNYGGPFNAAGLPAAIRSSPDGQRAYVTGWVCRTVPVGNNCEGEAATIAYDAGSGTELWHSFHATATGSAIPTALEVSPAGDRIFITGNSCAATDPAGNCVYEPTTVAYDASGAQQWVAHHPGPQGIGNMLTMAINPAGDRLFTGGWDCLTPASGNLCDGEFTTIAYDATSGAQLWTQNYSFEGYYAAGVLNMVVAPDGENVYVGGLSGSVGAGNTTYGSISAGIYGNPIDYVALSYSADTGAQHWVARYNSAATRADSDIEGAIGLSPDGSRLFVTGTQNYAGVSVNMPSNQYDFGTVAYDTGLVPLTGIVSRKVHGDAGEFDINLPLAGPHGIECRSGGANGDHTLVFTFANTLTSVDGASVTSGTGSVRNSHIDSNDSHNYVVPLTGVTNAQTIKVSLTNVTDSAGNFSSAVSVSMGVLLGDTTADGSVNSADIGQTKSQSGHLVTSSNFREDVTVDGSINSADIGLVKSKSGTALP